MTNPTIRLSDEIYEQRPSLSVQNVDPASNRANHSHPWELATYLNQIAGRGLRVPVRKRPFKRTEAHYENGPIIG